jgi:hypothetical protein
MDTRGDGGLKDDSSGRRWGWGDCGPKEDSLGEEMGLGRRWAQGMI